MILDKIAKATLIRVEKRKSEQPLNKLISIINDMNAKNLSHNPKTFIFEKTIKKSGKIAYICEVKKASPSKGIISKDFPYLSIAKEYEEAGAAAISVLTEPEYFMGKDSYLSEIRENVSLPLLRKDFIIDEYQIYKAKILGADAVLLISSLLDTETLKSFINLCDKLGMSALVEAHTKKEIDSAIEAGARVIGVNNRNLHNFEVDFTNCIKLRDFVPKDIIYVAESGVKTTEDIIMLKEAGVDAVLIGETLMKDRAKMREWMLL